MASKTKGVKVIEFCTVGDSGVGKSSLLMRYAENKFSSHLDATVGVEFVQRVVKLPSETVKVRIWDNSGIHSRPHHAETYCKSSQALLVCFDMTNRESFANIPWWLELCKENVPAHASLVLIACKADMEDERQVSKEEGARFAQKNCMMYFEISSKDPLVGASLERASSWFNRNSINGRYIPESDLSGVVTYRNMDCHGAAMQYETAMKGWVIRKHRRKVLAVLPCAQPSSNGPIITRDSRAITKGRGAPQGWKESAGVFLAWLFVSPHMRCEEYADERASMLPARAPVIFSRPSSNVKPNVADDPTKEDFEIIIDMMLFAQYSREPEQLGLDIPLFVRYCLVQLDILVYELHISLKESNRESDYDRMQRLKEKRNDLLCACQMLLSSISKTMSDVVPNNSLTSSSTIIDRGELIGTISELCDDMARRFEALCNMETGNFLAAKQCSATRKELLEDLNRIRDGKRSSLNYLSRPLDSIHGGRSLHDTFDTMRTTDRLEGKGDAGSMVDSQYTELLSLHNVPTKQRKS
eukprot:gene28343-34219_t